MALSTPLPPLLLAGGVVFDNSSSHSSSNVRCTFNNTSFSLSQLCLNLIARHFEKFKHNKNLTKYLTLELLERLYYTLESTHKISPSYLQFFKAPYGLQSSSLISNFKSLSFINLGWLYDKDLTELISTCIRLKTLTINKCPQIQQPLILSTTLQHLDLLHPVKKEFNPSINAPNLITFSINTPARRTRNILNQLMVTSPHIRSLTLPVPDLKSLPPSLFFPHLSQLDLSTSLITDASLVEILQKHSSLKVLILRKCKALSSPLIRTAKNLEVLILDGVNFSNPGDWLTLNVVSLKETTDNKRGTSSSGGDSCKSKLRILSLGGWNDSTIRDFIITKLSRILWDTTRNQINFND